MEGITQMKNKNNFSADHIKYVKKLKNENTSYSQIVTECRMRYAVQMLLMDNKNITQVAQLCGYSSTSYFISVFKAFYGLTPLNYLAKQRQKVMW